MMSIIAAWIVTCGLLMAHPKTNGSGMAILFFLMLVLTGFGFAYGQ